LKLKRLIHFDPLVTIKVTDLQKWSFLIALLALLDNESGELRLEVGWIKENHAWFVEANYFTI